MQYILSSNFNYIRNVVYTSDQKYCLIINAKFYSSMINNVHTMSPADMSATLQKSYGWQHSFQILSIFSYDICVGHQPADLGCQLMKCIWSITSKVTTIISLK